METDSTTLTCATCGAEYVARPEDAKRLRYSCDECIEASGEDEDTFDDEPVDLFVYD